MALLAAGLEKLQRLHVERLGAAGAHRLALAVFAGTLFLSALLLFSVQPLFAKMVLPKLGGSPSVWAVSMCFFQAVLLAGYCYAHALNRFLSPRGAPLVHLALIGLALLGLPFALPSMANEPPPGDAYWWLVGVLGLGVGLPFFAVSANAPLLQAWFSRSGHPHAADPYFLYGASNLGSLVALLAYPVAIEPFLGLARQAEVWTSGYVALSVLIAASGLLMLVGLKDAGFSAGPMVRAASGPRPSVADRAGWVGLALVPSGLLVAFTSYVTTDIASAPFLWVIPLAVFLATFILVFRDKPLIPHSYLLLAQPVLLVLAVLGMTIAGNRGWMIGSTAGFAAFFVTTMVCHRELFERRPGPAHLTEFYLWMSLGGVLGGLFAAIVAPQMFNAIYEFPLLLIAGLLCRPRLVPSLRVPLEVKNAVRVVLIMVGLIVALLVAIRIGAVPTQIARMAGAFIVVGAAVPMLMSLSRPLLMASAAVSAGLGLFVLPSALNSGIAERSFFGVHRVVVTPKGDMRLLLHGTTLHGAQRLKDDQGNAVEAPVPATYYHPASPMARGVEAARAASGKTGGGLVVGSIGLGAGSLACYSRPNEAWRFYEIDPVVVRIASDPRHFSFLSRCRPGADMVVGDARLTLAKEPAGKFDYLVIDAFSSDSVPVHLLTVEALALYLDKLAPNGLIAMHISNRHMDLVAVASALAVRAPGVHAVLVDDRPPARGFDAASSHVMFFARSPAAIERVAAWPDAERVITAPVAAWTDDYSDILSAIWRKYR